jgi:hypothetical protein
MGICEYVPELRERRRVCEDVVPEQKIRNAVLAF